MMILAVITGVLAVAMFTVARGMWTETLRDAVNACGVLLAIICVLSGIVAVLS